MLLCDRLQTAKVPLERILPRCSGAVPQPAESVCDFSACGTVPLNRQRQVPTHLTTEQVIEALAAFVPSDDEREVVCRLYEIFEGLSSRPDRRSAVPAMFGLMERYPEAILGTPGPLVHELEAIEGYAAELRESVLRQPSYLTVWMINRILNGEPDDDQRRRWRQLLEVASKHPLTPELAREEAVRFIAHQRSRD